MNPADTIRHRADGSIDTSHYMARGRRARSAQAHSLLRVFWRRPAAPSQR